MTRIQRRICGACLLLLLAATFAGCLMPREAMPDPDLSAPRAVVTPVRSIFGR
ncbi:MAG TPA: hypothetical protein GX702_13575 [Chloroflexi bacterium]|nr:hypothetical protein [Chloroflexota bacterium]